MKRLLCTVLLFITVFTVTACGNSRGRDNSDTQTESSISFTELPTTENSSSETVSSEDTSADGTAKFSEADNENGEEANTEMRMKVEVSGSIFTAVLEKNDAADAFVEMMENEPVVIQMSDYSGFEKVGALGRSLPADNSQMTTAAGDIVLYQGNQIVIFYGSNSWSYTKLGRIDDLIGWEDALGSGDVTVTFSLD